MNVVIVAAIVAVCASNPPEGVYVQKQLGCEKKEDGSYKMNCDADGVIITLTDDVAGATSNGAWSPWFNDDHPSGSGDKETIHDIWMYSAKPMRCSDDTFLKCRTFSALKVNFADDFAAENPDETIDKFGNRLQIKFEEDGGILCLNDEQEDNGFQPKCANYKVKFFCKDVDQWCCKEGENCDKYLYNWNYDKRLLSVLTRLLRGEDN